MKHIAILGSTGSVGSNALEVIRHFPTDFRVSALSAKSNIGLLYRQIQEFKPRSVCVEEEKAALKLKSRLGASKVKVFAGQEGLDQMIKGVPCDKIVLAISGSMALRPLLASIKENKDIALANKEALVMAGAIVIQRLKESRSLLIPIDSEQSAIWQCLDGRSPVKLQKIYLTASGGPFRNMPYSRLSSISVREALRHPRWKMGKKITIDSSTLMNKGLEVIEAMHLFGVTPDKIKVLVHPEAIIHSMVEFVDGVVLAQLSVTDMRIPIQYSLSYPQRLLNGNARIDFFKLKRFTFEEPDFKKFPCLRLAYWAAEEGGTSPCVLNAANEAGVAAFLENRIRFTEIPEVIEKTIARHKNILRPDLDEIIEADLWARAQAGAIIKRMN